MGLETGTFVDDLVSSNPVGSTDGVKKGDDHLRLIKSVLKATFPNATKAFRFESVLTKTTTYPVVVGDARALVLADASGGAFTITLPLGSTVFAGYTVLIMKSDSASNDVTVDGNGAETINGSATRTLSTQYEGEKYTWDGSEWKVIALTKVGTSELLDGAITAAKLASDAVTTVKVLNSNITLAKIADMATDRILGREASGSGVIEQLTLGSGLDLTGGAIRITPNGVTGAHIALGSDASGDIMYYNGTDWVRLAKGADGEFLSLASGIPSWVSDPGVTRETAVTTTSGTAHGFTGIIAGANRIAFMLNGTSLSGTDEFLIQLGDAGGYETAGYASVAGNEGASSAGPTSGYLLNRNSVDGSLWNGAVVFRRHDGNIWVMGGSIENGTSENSCSGSKTLSAELDRIQITRTGSDTFDAGSVNILVQ